MNGPQYALLLLWLAGSCAWAAACAPRTGGSRQDARLIAGVGGLLGLAAGGVYFT